MNKKILGFIIGSLLIISLTGCGKDKQVELEKVTVILDWVPNTNHTGLYVALENGYYKDEGLEVEIIQPAGSSAELIAAGQGQFGVSYQEQVTYARTAEDPLPIKAIAAIVQNNTSGFASLSSTEILVPKDFEGKKYGGWGAPVEQAMIKGLMEEDGGDLSKLEMIDIGELDFFAAVENHVDFTWIFYGWDGVAAKQKGIDINFIKLQDVVEELDFYSPVIISNEDFLESNPETAKKFLRSISKGYEFAIDNPKEAGQLLLKHAPELDEEIVIGSQEYLAKEYSKGVDQWGIMKEEKWDTYGSWMYNHDLLSARLDAKEAFTNEFLPKE